MRVLCALFQFSRCHCCSSYLGVIVMNTLQYLLVLFSLFFFFFIWVMESRYLTMETALPFIIEHSHRKKNSFFSLFFIVLLLFKNFFFACLAVCLTLVDVINHVKYLSLDSLASKPSSLFYQMNWLLFLQFLSIYICKLFNDLFYSMKYSWNVFCFHLLDMPFLYISINMNWFISS